MQNWKKKFGLLLSGMSFVPAMFCVGAGAADKVVVVIPLKMSARGVVEVTSAGQTWMDRNLGALRAATKIDDPDAYGALYQWGRLGDGHEYRGSPTTLVRSSGDVPGHGNFIKVPDEPYSIPVELNHYDWRVKYNSFLWGHGIDPNYPTIINNPCPAGFRVPTKAEWETERLSWSSNDAVGAFASSLKLVVAGYRDHDDGTILGAGSNGNYWSTTSDIGGIDTMYFYDSSAINGFLVRADGASVRCIKD